MKSKHKSRSEGSQTLFSGIFMVSSGMVPRHTYPLKAPEVPVGLKEAMTNY